MSQKELTRLEIMHMIEAKRITQVQAVEMLQINLRHVKRLYKQYKTNGAKGIISKRRGKPSNRKLPSNFKELAITLIKEHYHDFGPTFAQKKLSEKHDLRVSLSSLRKWMIAEKIWIPRAERLEKVYQPLS